MADHEPAPEASQPLDPAVLLQRIERLESLVAALTNQRTVSQPLPAPAPAIVRASQPAAARSESLETQFGARVLSKVAVVLLLIGAAWFLKWAFDNRWIGAQGRVLAGLLVGVGVFLWSERFRRQGLAGFSYSLKAVGSGVLYLSLWAGFQVYHLMPALVALLAMLAVTVCNAWLAFSQDAELLAAFALFGGYLTPALLTTGGDHEIFLFTYLFLFAAAVLALLLAKPWSRLLLGALPITVAYFIAWYSQHFDPSNASRTLFFALLLWATFAAVPLLAREPEGPIAGVLTPLAAAAFGALTVYSVLADTAGRAFEPWAAIAFAAVYLLLTRIRRSSVASAVHLSLAIVFLTIAIPLKATGRAITAGWLAESVALLWVATLPHIDRRATQALRWLAAASLLLGVIGALISPWFQGPSQQAFLNRNFAISLGAIAALSVAIYFSSRSSDNVIATGSFILINLVLLLSMYREIFLYFHNSVAPTAWSAATEQSDFAFSGWMMLQGAALMVAGFWRRLALPRWLGLTLLAATAVKAFAYDMRNLGTGYRVISYLGLGIVLMAVSFAYQKDWLNLKDTKSGEFASRHHHEATQ